MTARSDFFSQTGFSCGSPVRRVEATLVTIGICANEETRSCRQMCAALKAADLLHVIKWCPPASTSFPQPKQGGATPLGGATQLFTSIPNIMHTANPDSSRLILRLVLPRIGRCLSQIDL